MNKYNVKDIPRDSFFSKPVRLDDGFVLASPEMPFSEELALAVAGWSFQEVYSSGEPLENYMPEGASSSGVPADINDLSTMGDADKIREAEGFFTTFQWYTDILFSRITVKKKVDYNTVAERVKVTIDFIRKNRNFLMRALRKTEPPEDKDYLSSHGVRSMVIAIIIGMYLKLPAHRLIDLGVAALLHEIGMLQVSPHLYLNKRSLSETEKKAIRGHPEISFNMLRFFGFPSAVSTAALEHHERENGSGYPESKRGDKISLYGKIIAVACAYEALSSKRPHKEAQDGYTVMLAMLKNEGKQFDEAVIRALVFSLSIYPIGMYVLLSNDKKGQVVDVNPDDPRYPVVQVFGELTPDGNNKTAQTQADGLTIVRPLTREEIGG